MDDIEAPSFCLGLDFDDDLRRGTSSSDARTDEHLHIQHTAVCTTSKLPPNKIENTNQNVSTSCTRFQLIDSDLDSDHSCASDSDNNNKCNRPVDESSNLLEKRVCVPKPVMEESFGPIKHESNAIVQTNRSNRVARSFVNVDDSFYLPAHRYYFHDDPRIQELVRSRLPDFSPLGNPLNRDPDQPSTSNIDYMKQFSCGESSKQSTDDKQSLSRRKFSRKLKADDASQGWVNPKLGVNKATTKRGIKRKVHADHQTPGHWLTGSNGKKIYVGKTGQELTGRVAYMQYKKESGREFKKGKRKSATKKKKK